MNDQEFFDKIAEIFTELLDRHNKNKRAIEYARACSSCGTVLQKNTQVYHKKTEDGSRYLCPDCYSASQGNGEVK